MFRPEKTKVHLFWIVITVFMAGQTFFPGNSISQSTNNKKGPWYVITKDEFYEMENLQEAARAIRERARSLEINIFEIPVLHDNFYTPGNKEVIQVKLSWYKQMEIKIEESCLDSLSSLIKNGDGLELFTALLVL